MEDFTWEICFKDQGQKRCCLFPFTFYWLELNYMTPDDHRGDWEMQLCAKEEQEIDLL